MNRSEVVGRVACPKCQERGDDKSSDNLVMYADGGAFCYSCHFFVSDGKLKIETQEDSETYVMPQHTLEAVLTKRGISPQVIADYGVQMIEQEGSYWVSFPVFDNAGAKHTEHLRLIDASKGELTREMRYPKGTKLRVPLFGLNRVTPHTKTILLTEGETDALVAASLMIGRKDVAVVGVLGSAMAKRAAAYCARYWAEHKVVVAFDNDNAGKLASQTFIDELRNYASEDFTVFRLEYPDGVKDIGEWQPKDLFQKLEQAAPYLSSDLLTSEVVAKRLRSYLKRLSEGHYIELQFSPTLNKTVKLIPGGLYGVIGDGGSGKSTLCEHILMSAITKGKYVLVESYEMIAEQIAQKFMQMVDGLPYNSLDFLKTLSEDALDKLESDVERVLKWMTIVDNASSSNFIESMDKHLLELAAAGRSPEVVLVDHLLAVTKGLTPEGIIETTKDLLMLARKHNTAVIIVSHIRKPPSTSTRTLYRPEAKDCYGSMALAMLCSWILACTKDQEKRQTLVETIKTDRMNNGAYADITLDYVDFCLREAESVLYSEHEKTIQEETTDDSQVY